MKRILALAIDDEAGVLIVLQRSLVPEGIDVVPADSLAKGIREIAEQDFDCILLDLNLGDSDGIATFWRLKAAVRKKTPIVVFSGKVTPAMELELAHNDVRVVGKPSSTDELAYTIRLVVGEAEQARSQSPTGMMAPIWVAQLRDEVKRIVDPMQHDVGRVVAWMNTTLAAQEKAAQQAQQPKVRRSPIQVFHDTDWVKLGISFSKFAGVVTVATAAATACVRLVVTDALRPVQQAAQQNQVEQRVWRNRDRVEENKPTEPADSAPVTAPRTPEH